MLLLGRWWGVLCEVIRLCLIVAVTSIELYKTICRDASVAACVTLYAGPLGFAVFQCCV